jgi:hypothetical protein
MKSLKLEGVRELKTLHRGGTPYLGAGAQKQHLTPSSRYFTNSLSTPSSCFTTTLPTHSLNSLNSNINYLKIINGGIN